MGGGPAGLRAAEVLAGAGCGVTVCERKPSAGRKFLVAGGGGLNLTHSEALDAFAARYGAGEAGRWRALLEAFPPAALREWAAGLGVETFVGTSGRVFPFEKKAAPLLRRWIERLRRLGVRFRVEHEWTGWERAEGRLRLSFRHRGEAAAVEADAALLALGGASWPETGSDGSWTGLLRERGIAVASWRPANCGWEASAPWPPELLAAAEGKPLKNVAATAGATRVEGECVVTRYGLEGGLLYPLGPVLRGMERPLLRLDFKPSLSPETLRRKWGAVPRRAEALLPSAVEKWRLGPAAAALLAAAGPYTSPEELVQRVKDCPVPLSGPRPLAEAISSAGGLSWDELDAGLMLRREPGLFAAGEMIDWEAPTGGYLLQGCFATGDRAARGMVAWLGSFSS